MSEEIINRVSRSGIITLNLEDFFPEGERIVYDIKDNLWQGMALKEKDFREFVKHHDWTTYQDKFVSLHCSIDAIVPNWAYMLLITKLQPYAREIFVGDADKMEEQLLDRTLNSMDFSEYQDARVVIKGCSNKSVPLSAYTKITAQLMPYAKVIMYGEPCSTVPLWKKPKS